MVVNLSQRPLSTQEEDVLSLGLSFAIIPRQIPYQEIISATEATAHRLDHRTAEALRLAVRRALQQAKPPLPNLTFQQRRAIQDFKRDESIVLIPTDKGRATMIMDKDEYTQKMCLGGMSDP